MRVLLIEDDVATALNIEHFLMHQGVRVSTACNAQEGMGFARLYEFDAILLDTTLPDEECCLVLKRIRDLKAFVPVIILGAENPVRIAQLLNLGADDCVNKPFHCDELVARMYAVVRRWHGFSTSCIVNGNLVVNIALQEVTVNHKVVHLTWKEYAIVSALVLHLGTTFSRERLLQRLYSDSEWPEPNVIDAFVSQIRKRFREAESDSSIVTERGQGYRIVKFIARV